MFRIVLLSIGIIFVVLVFKLLISGKMSERTSLPWIACSFFIIILSAFPYTIDKVAKIIHIDYPPTLLFLVAILILFLLVLYQSIHLSVLQHKILELAQAVSIMRSTSSADRQDEMADFHQQENEIEQISNRSD